MKRSKGTMKKRLSEQQEFDIMKMVLDKFLWLGFILMAFGLYKSFQDNVVIGLSWIIVGAFLLVLFMILIVKEFEVIK
jgi:hypothetical protein